MSTEPRDRTATGFRARTLFCQDLATLVLEGELDYDTLPELSRALATVRDRHPLALHLDLSRLAFCDVTGLNLLLRTKYEAGVRQLGFDLYGARPSVLRLFRSAGVDGRLEPLVARPHPQRLDSARLRRVISAARLPGSGASGPPRRSRSRRR